MTDPKNEIVERIRAAKDIVLLTHVNPDGDALGTVTAFARAMRTAGKTAAICLPGLMPDEENYIRFGEELTGASGFPSAVDAADLLVIADTCSHNQLDDIDSLLPPFRDKTVVIDHHATGDEIGSVRWVDCSAAAASVMVYELLGSLGWPVTEDVAYPLAVGILTDTGWLRFSNADARCLRTVADLIEAGVKPDVLYKQIYQNDRFEKLKLMGKALESLELHCDGRLAVLTLLLSDFEATGARPDETENLVNEAMRIDGVEAAVILIENDHEIRVSLRSREFTDVSEVAASFGGGGHTRAAGLRLAGPVEVARNKIIAALAERL